MYVMRNNGHLYEMTKAEYKAHTRHGEQAEYYAVTTAAAHRHVREGGMHSTPLYIRDKKIRRAT